MYSDLDIIALRFPVTSVQKCIAGNGRAGKDVVRKVFTDKGINPRSDDESDALAVAVTCMIKNFDHNFLDRLEGLKVVYQ